MTRKKFLMMLDGAVVKVDFIGAEKHFDVIKNGMLVMYFSVDEKYLTVLENDLKIFDDAHKVSETKAFFRGMVWEQFGWEANTVNLL